ncbi:MAG: bifunctional folylpolyglutamate synthase/dihydrofolate synthase [Muribaculaceae bacterium]|nr:bifunctional folylpolyglutamate synthase/dihydrofolate synthase [Muribaculaceae bacterium]
MTYQQTIDYLYNQLPMFERQGAGAYKPGLKTSEDLDNMFGNPHRNYRIIHVAGTNGKGSVSHFLASILQSSGYKVGLYTSPHLVDFRERIRVNGEMIEKEAVTSFLQRYLDHGYNGSPTFFELTSTMAFEYFALRKVDFAIIEVGLGGRLDSTNIVTPTLSVITNISLDHTQFLGSTLAEVASEKAGIIKPNVPVVVGEAVKSTRRVFEQKAMECGSKLTFACDNKLTTRSVHRNNMLLVSTTNYGTLKSPLLGNYQVKNMNTVLNAVEVLIEQGVRISPFHVSQGIENVVGTTGIIGRWMQLNDEPRVVCDSGHNIGAFKNIVRQLKREPCNKMRIVVGFMADKSVEPILSMLPHDACYYFTQADSPRALPAVDLLAIAKNVGLHGKSCPVATQAYAAALNDSAPDDFIYVGGSMYVLAEILAEVVKEC